MNPKLTPQQNVLLQQIVKAGLAGLRIGRRGRVTQNLEKKGYITVTVEVVQTESNNGCPITSWVFTAYSLQEGIEAAAEYSFKQAEKGFWAQAKREAKR